MEAALRRATVVQQWRRERIVTRPHVAMRDVIEVQVGEDHAASLRRSDSMQDQ